jgi:hypothetical protein
MYPTSPLSSRVEQPQNNHPSDTTEPPVIKKIQRTNLGFPEYHNETLQQQTALQKPALATKKDLLAELSSLFLRPDKLEEGATLKGGSLASTEIPLSDEPSYHPLPSPRKTAKTAPLLHNSFSDLESEAAQFYPKLRSSALDRSQVSRHQKPGEELCVANDQLSSVQPSQIDRTLSDLEAKVVEDEIEQCRAKNNDQSFGLFCTMFELKKVSSADPDFIFWATLFGYLSMEKARQLYIFRYHNKGVDLEKKIRAWELRLFKPTSHPMNKAVSSRDAEHFQLLQHLLHGLWLLDAVLPGELREEDPDLFLSRFGGYPRTKRICLQAEWRRRIPEKVVGEISQGLKEPAGKLGEVLHLMIASRAWQIAPLPDNVEKLQLFCVSMCKKKYQASVATLLNIPMPQQNRK